jgi:hypothetical protein
MWKQFPTEGNLSKQFPATCGGGYFVPTYINIAGHATDRQLSTAKPSKSLYSSKKKKPHFALQYANWSRNAGLEVLTEVASGI